MRKNKKNIEANVALEDFAANNDIESEDFVLKKGLPIVEENVERDYFTEYYNIYKNDYITQYLEAYKNLKIKSCACPEEESK